MLRKLRSCIAITVIAIAATPAIPANAEAQDKSVIGRWRLTAVLDSAEVSALDDAQAAKLVGQVLSIGPNLVKLGKRTCGSPPFEVTVAETDDYLYRYANTISDNLGLPNPVTAVNLGCMEVYHKPPNRLVIFWQGVFFDAVRQR